MRFLKRSFLFLTAILLFAVCFSKCNATLQKKNTFLTADKILIKKSQRKMELYAKEKLIKSYKISLGFAPIGPKQQAGGWQNTRG